MAGTIAVSMRRANGFALPEAEEQILNDRVKLERLFVNGAPQIPYFSPETQAIILRHVPRKKDLVSNLILQDKDVDLFKKLPTKEQDIIRLIGAGKKSKEIAHLCGGTPRSVDNLIQKLTKKFHLSTRSELATHFAPLLLRLAEEN